MEHHSNIVLGNCWLHARYYHQQIPMNDKGELLLDRIWKCFRKDEDCQCNKFQCWERSITRDDCYSPYTGCLSCGCGQSVPHLKGCTELDATFVFRSKYMDLPVSVFFTEKRNGSIVCLYQGGGRWYNMSFEKTTFNELPFKSADYIGTTGLAKALDYVTGLGIENIASWARADGLWYEIIGDTQYPYL